MGVAEATLHRWKKHNGGLEVTEIRRLLKLEAADRRLRQLVAELALDQARLQDVLRKGALTRDGGEVGLVTALLSPSLGFAPGGGSG